MKIITLPDGYNGHTEDWFINPIAIDNNLIKLQCANKDKEYVFRWVRIEECNKILFSELYEQYNKLNFKKFINNPINLGKIINYYIEEIRHEGKNIDNLNNDIKEIKIKRIDYLREQLEDYQKAYIYTINILSDN